jgi:hypothetical protein
VEAGASLSQGMKRKIDGNERLGWALLKRWRFEK